MLAAVLSRSSLLAVSAIATRGIRTAPAAMAFPDFFGTGNKPGGGAAASVTLSKDSAPSWDSLQASVLATATGAALAESRALNKEGKGDAHTDAPLRLFDAKSEDEVRVTFFRDTAAWCPYCQKVWLLLEEKRIPYKVSKINMRSYGDKPAWFLSKVPNGLLPAIEVDGKFMSEHTHRT